MSKIQDGHLMKDNKIIQYMKPNLINLEKTQDIFLVNDCHVHTPKIMMTKNMEEKATLIYPSVFYRLQK